MHDTLLTGRKVLVTGGTGTIGSEIVRQVLSYDPQVVRVLSRDETKQAHLRVALGDDPRVRLLIGDVRDFDRLRVALDDVDIVFHAAALKHVPACEYNPFEAVQTNVIGTQNIVIACRDAGVERLVLISTDKAVNPSNTMGATKLLAENLVRASQEWNPSLRLSAVRFGNVLGSRGSLLPMIESQIRERRRIEITSRTMTRFMMTIPDAVGLVLHAAAMSRGGELYILEMPALRVSDLIEVFVEELAARDGFDAEAIPWVETGVRPGEKMHESLVTLEEWQRLEALDGMYVVHALRSLPVEERSRIERRIAQRTSIDRIPDAFDSSRARLLDREQIRGLIQRSAYFERADTVRAVETQGP